MGPLWRLCLFSIVSTLLAFVVDRASAQRTAKGPMPSIMPAFRAAVPASWGLRLQNYENRFIAEIFSSSNQTYFAGQEVRVRISTMYYIPEDHRNDASAPSKKTGHIQVPLTVTYYVRYTNRSGRPQDGKYKTNVTMFPGWNITGPSPVRFRVVPAYGGRASNGPLVPCREQNDVWFETWAYSGRSLMFGRRLALSAFSTFVVPPFPWRICVKDVSWRNATRQGFNWDLGRNSRWRAFDKDSGIQPYRDPLFLWYSSSTMQVGDFAAIKFIVNGRFTGRLWNGHSFDPFKVFPSGSSSLRGDLVKLVPAGMPCTYEKTGASAEKSQNIPTVLQNTKNQYCGSNYVKPAGTFVTSQCHLEGAVQGGVVRTGTERKNPYSTATTILPGEQVPSGVHLVGYLQLPAAGRYEICLSPQSFRQTLVNVTASPVDFFFNPVPVWFKVFNAGPGCPTSSAAAAVRCQPSKLALTVTPATNSITYSTTEGTIYSWGAIKFQGSGLNSNPAVNWEHSNPREYFSTVGGDQFRLVPMTSFGSPPAMTNYGTLYRRPDGTRYQLTFQTQESPTVSFETASRLDEIETDNVFTSYTLRQYVLGTPAEGTQLPDSAPGCWSNAMDNYGSAAGGLNANTATSQCCSGAACTSASCSQSDQDYNGVTASSDLGGDPRTPFRPWRIDTTSAANVWAYVRFLPGQWRVCYRRAGTENWRQVPATGSPNPLLWDLIPKPDKISSNITYYINDTTEGSVGEFRVQTRYLQTNLLDYNLFSSDPAVVGSTLKIVKTTASCATDDAEYLAGSTRPGSRECSIGECAAATPCVNCLGAANNSAGLTSMLVFFLRLPKHSTTPSVTYRVCFRYGLSNWYDLSSLPLLPRTAFLPGRRQLNTREGALITYTISDRREGTWGYFIIRHRDGHGPLFNSFPNPRGASFRLVRNESAHRVPTMCNAVWGTTSADPADLQLQEFNPLFSSGDLGLYCRDTSVSVCTTSRLSPPNGVGMSGTFPYNSADGTADLENIPSTEGLAAFVTLPAAVSPEGSVASYRVCYKPTGQTNWVELTSDSGPAFLQIAPRPTVSMTVPYGTVYAGMYGYVGLSATATRDAFNLAADLVKLVQYPTSCDRPPAGSVYANNLYTAMAGHINLRGGARLVDGTSDTTAFAGAQPPTSMFARAYMSFPVQNTAAATTTTFRVCYIKRSSTADNGNNWMDLGAVNVVSLGVTYDLLNQPIYRGASTFRLLASAATRMNTTAAGDRVKIVDEASPCAASPMPLGVASLDLNLKFALQAASRQELGFTDLGPSDAIAATMATFPFTFPTSSNALKVCWQPYGLPWVEIANLPSGQTYPIVANNLQPSTSSISSFTLTSSIRGQVADLSQIYYASGVQYVSTALAGASTIGGITYTATSVSALDTIKFVINAPETGPGQWVERASTTCLDDAFVQINATVDIPTRGIVGIALPYVPAQYLLCVRLAGTPTWIQVASSLPSVYNNPFPVIATRLTYALSVGTSSVTVRDANIVGTTAQGALSINDQVYMVNASDYCGASDGFSRLSFTDGSALLRLNGTSNTTLMAERVSGAGSWISPSTFSQFVKWYKLCYRRTNASSTMRTDSPSTIPFAGLGWYELLNDDPATGGPTPFFSPSKATKIVMDSCSATAAMRTGRSFILTASTRNGNGDTVPFPANGVAQDVAVTENSAFVLQNTAGACQVASTASYSVDPQNLQQFTTNGLARFVLSPLSSCPPGGCVIQLAASGLTSVGTCTYTVVDSPVASLQTTFAPTECPLDGNCIFRVAAFAADGDLAYTAVDAISVTISGNAGLTTFINGQSVTNTASPGSLSSGFLAGTMRFSLQSAAIFASTAWVTFVFSAGNGTTTRFSVLVRRPAVVGIHIVDVYPSPPSEAATLDGDISFVRAKLVPSWEPPRPNSMRGGLTQVNGAAQYSAGPGYYIVAQQFYTVVFRAVTDAGTYANDVALLPSSRQLITAAFAGQVTGNSILAFSADCATSESCATPHTGSSFNSPKPHFVFRLKNAVGCGSSAPCTISFKFGGSDIGMPAQITTPVRSPTATLSVACYANTATDTTSTPALTGAGTRTCPPSAVEFGWNLVVTAVDLFGNVDEYFQGKVILALNGGTNVAVLTTVGSLRNQRADPVPPTPSVMGVAFIPFVTLSSPCLSGCSLQVLTDWGAPPASVGVLVAPPSTVKLNCTIATPLMRCTTNSDGTCATVDGPFFYDINTPQNNRNALLYSDTQLCVDVQAVNTNNVPTLYDTVWIHYYLTSIAPASAPLTIVDNAQQTLFARRYRPMANGKVRFCFSVTGATSLTTFTLRFDSQRFSTPAHWTTTGGSCSLGTLAVNPTKLIGQLQVLAVTAATPVVPMTTFPSSYPIVAFTRGAATSVDLTVDFKIYDHYGVEIKAASLAAQHSNMQVVIDNCNVAGLPTTCAAGDLTPVAGQPTVSIATGVDPHVYGALLVTLLQAPLSSVTGLRTRYWLRVTKFCIACRISFSVRNVTESVLYTAQPLTGIQGNVSATIEMNVLLANDAASARLVGFAPGTSPMRFWRTWNTYNAFASGVILFNDSCIFNSGCQPQDSQFIDATCSDSSKVTLAPNGAPLKLYVSVAEPDAALTSYYENSCVFDDCSTASRVKMQADILTTYTIAFSVGSQILACDGTPCIDDRTGSPKQVVPAFGGTLIDAINAVKASGFQYHSTSFTLSGLFASDYYQTTGTGKFFSQVAPPSRGGNIMASATGNVSTGLTITPLTTTGYSLYWKGAGKAKMVAIRSVSGNSDCPFRTDIPCLSGPGGPCPYNGFKQLASFTDIAYNMSSLVYAGVPFPFSVDVLTADGTRVFAAAGSVSCIVSSYMGCNNGGTFTLAGSGSISNGRYTDMATFSAPCEGCVVKCTLTPSNSQRSTVYSDMLLSPSTFVAYSSPLYIGIDKTQPTHLMATTSPTSIPSALTVATAVTLNFVTVAAIGNLMVNEPGVATVAFYVNPAATVFNQLWYGNGGLLRAGSGSSLVDRHAVQTTISNAGAASFMFTRTCTLGCSVTAAWEFAQGSRNTGSFAVLNSAGSTFTVTTTATKYVLVGFRPRSAQRNTDFAVAVWHMGSELADQAVNPIPVAGVATGNISDSVPAVVTPAVSDGTNGDGGVVAMHQWHLDRTEIHRISFSRPCNGCQLSFSGGEVLAMQIVTTATNIRVATPASGFWTGVYPASATANFDLTAVDDDGFQDNFFGGVADCTMFPPFLCNSLASTVVMDLQTTNAPMDDPNARPFLSSQQPTVTGTIVSGRGVVAAVFPSPVRGASPLLTASTSTSTIGGLGAGVVQIGTGDTSAATVGLKAPTSVTAFVPFLIGVSMTRAVTGLGGAYIVGDASNAFTLAFANCPRLLVTPTAITLTGGYANLSITFANPISTSQCSISVTVASAPVRCTTCTVTASMSVAAVVAAGWRWVTPGPWDNGAAVSGPMYGAVGRRMTLTMQLVGANGVDTRDCDDLLTPAIEMCTVAVTSTCTSATISPQVAFDVNGQAVVTVDWQDPSPPSCPLSADVERAGAPLPPVAGNAKANAVTVCKPAKLVSLSNISRVAALATGVAVEMRVGVVDAAGRVCRGDSQHDATAVSIDVVTSLSSSSSLTIVQAVNTNVTNSLSPYPSGEQGASRTAKLLSGSFSLKLVFTNSTLANGLSTIMVRLLSPQLGTLWSPPMQTAVQAARLRLKGALPRYAVAGVPLYDPQNGGVVLLEAVDRVGLAADGTPDPSWLPIGLGSNAPNVPTQPGEFGVDAAYSWLVQPPLGTFPFSFQSGLRDGRLSGGRMTFRGLLWAAGDGTTAISVTSASLLPTQAMTVTFQSRRSMAWNISYYQGKTTCQTACPLPNGTFTPYVSGVPAPYYFIEAFQPFNLQLAILDSAGAVVLGDYESVIVLTLTGANDTASLADPITQRPVPYVAARVVAGIANFSNITFTGYTGNYTRVQLRFSCPPQRPVELRLPNDISSDNKCSALGSISSADILIKDIRAPRSVYDDGTVLQNTLIVKVRSRFSSLSLFNVTQFTKTIARELNTRGFPYVEPNNADKSITALVCEVLRPRFLNYDLGTSVCRATPGQLALSCSIQQNYSCPQAVFRCACPFSASARRLQSLSRFLLGSDIDLQVEVYFQMYNAVGYVGTTVSDVAAQLLALGATTKALLMSNATSLQSFALDATSVSSRTAVEAPQEVPPTPPPATPVPPTPAPSTKPTLPPASASALSLAAIIVMPLLVFFAAG